MVKNEMQHTMHPIKQWHQTAVSICTHSTKTRM